MRVNFASEPRGPEQPNEDFLAATPDVVVLLDGVGVAGTESGCIHGTPWFVRQLGSTVAATLATDPAIELTAALAHGIQAVRGRHQDTCDVDHPGTPSSTALLVRQRDDQLDYLVLADSVLILETKNGLDVISDEREAPVADLLRDDIDATSNGTPQHQVAVNMFMTRMAAYRNVPHGFWVASNNPEAVDEAIVGSVPLAELHSIAVLSDGASRLVDTFHLAGWEGLHRMLADNGPAELIRQVRDAECADPQGQRWSRGKIHDDATAVYCTFLVDR